MAVGCWVRLVLLHNLGTRRLRNRMAGRCTLAQFDVLAQLAPADGDESGLTQADLARRLMMSPGNITGLVDRLVRLRWVRRVSSPRDRRSVHIRLTPQGRALVAKVLPEYRREAARLFEALDPIEKAGLEELLDRVGSAIAE